MQHTTALARTIPPHITMQILIDRHGAWVALRAFLRALVGVRKRQTDIAAMADHLRRDNGLAERGEPPPALRDLWM